MDPSSTGLASKRKALQELFRSRKRVHISQSGNGSDDQRLAAGPTEQRDNGLAEMAWSAFKAALPMVEKVSGVFPPLQGAIGGLMEVIAQFDVSNHHHIALLTNGDLGP